MILKPTMAEHLAGISAGLESILPEIEGPPHRQVLLAVMFLRRLALRANRFDGVLRADTLDLWTSLERVLELFESASEAVARAPVAALRESWQKLASPPVSGEHALACPDADDFIARNLELQALLVEAQDLAATLAPSLLKEQVTELLRAFHERTLDRAVGLGEAQQ